jgi:hypothetical protein
VSNETPLQPFEVDDEQVSVAGVNSGFIDMGAVAELMRGWGTEPETSKACSCSCSVLPAHGIIRSRA